MTEQVPAAAAAPPAVPDLAAEAERLDAWLREREAKNEAKRLQAKADRQRLRKHLAEEREAAASRAAALEPKIPIPPNFIALRCRCIAQSHVFYSFLKEIMLTLHAQGSYSSPRDMQGGGR